MTQVLDTVRTIVQLRNEFYPLGENIVLNPYVDDLRDDLAPLVESWKKYVRTLHQQGFIEETDMRSINGDLEALPLTTEIEAAWHQLVPAPLDDEDLVQIDSEDTGYVDEVDDDF